MTAINFWHEVAISHTEQYRSNEPHLFRDTRLLCGDGGGVHEKPGWLAGFKLLVCYMTKNIIKNGKWHSIVLKKYGRNPPHLPTFFYSAYTYSTTYIKVTFHIDNDKKETNF